MEYFKKSSFGIFITQLFACYFTKQSWGSFVVLAYGWSLSKNRHTIANYIWISGGVKYKHFSQYYCFLNQSLYKVLDGMWEKVLCLLDYMLAADVVFELIVDDTTRKKSGRRIEGASNYRNGAGSARQEYRNLWGINFVYVMMKFVWVKNGVAFKLSVPAGLRVYLKKDKAKLLGKPYFSRSGLARQIINRIVGFLPHRAFKVKADGGYSTKEFLKDLTGQAEVTGRFPIKSRLFNLPPKKKGERKKMGRPSTKGKDLGTPKEWIKTKRGWKAHPTEHDVFIKSVVGQWHSVLRAKLIKVVLVWRKNGVPQGKRSGKKQLEAFFSSNIELSDEKILEEYKERWAVEIDIRDGYAYYGLGKDHCRKVDRIYAINSFRLLMAACRTLWFVYQFEYQDLDLNKYRPWYRQKTHPTQLDIICAAQEAFVRERVFPIPRFFDGRAKSKRNLRAALDKVA